MQDINISAVKAHHEKKLMKISGVIGVGIGKENEEEVIVILTDSLPAKSAKKIPKDLKGYKVILRETGRIDAQTSR